MHYEMRGYCCRLAEITSCTSVEYLNGFAIRQPLVSRGFALLAGTEAIARGILISVFPLEVYSALKDAQTVSAVYLVVGLVSLISGLSVPFVTRYLPRRWVYIVGVSMFISGSLLAIVNAPAAIITSLFLITIATVVMFVCFNAYVLDFIAKVELGQCETSRMFYSALGWTIGPVLGVVLLNWWRPGPFIVAAIASSAMLMQFLYMRLGSGRLITRARKVQPNPLSYLARFAVQPRLVSGWIFAVIRSCGWWVYVIYLPIFAIENGLSDKVGGIVLSISNAALFFYTLHASLDAPTFNTQGGPCRFSICICPLQCSNLVNQFAVVCYFCLMCGSFFLILLDVSAGLPFLLAVRPSERTEMSAVYSIYRDISGIITPGAAWLVLLISPISGIFLAAGASLLAAWTLAGKLHPRLGMGRVVFQARAD